MPIDVGERTPRPTGLIESSYLIGDSNDIK